MKKIIASLGTFAMFLLMAMPVLAVKPTDNLAAAKNVEWNLSADVMPVPPYGSYDIPGSDMASKLIVNQPNGNTEVALTGVMKGLNPNTSYTVYLSKGYTPYEFTGWNVTGSYVINLTYMGVDYTEYLELVQSGTDITGTSLALAGNASPWTIESGNVDGNTVSFVAHFNSNPSLHATFEATIANDGALVDGIWADVAPGTRTGTWATTSGSALKTHTGSTGWPGLFTSAIQPFTFITDEFGSSSWHLNLKEDLGLSGEKSLSVWINHGGTLLISDVFNVVFE